MEADFGQALDRRKLLVSAPNFPHFLSLIHAKPGIPPTYEEKAKSLEAQRRDILRSQNAEDQLDWAQDTLSFFDVALGYLQRLATRSGDTSSGHIVIPALEHRLQIDSMQIVIFLADQVHPRAQFIMGMWFEFGKFGYPMDKEEAFKYYTRSAEKGFGRAEYRIAMLYEQWDKIDLALQHYRRGSELGDSASNYRLGIMYLVGQAGQERSPKRGLELLRASASSADSNAPQGAYVLGMLHAGELREVSGGESFVEYDETEAIRNISKAAHLGFSKAQVKMGMAYELCWMGCEFSPALSIHYNFLASLQGEPEAEMALSKWYLCGYNGLFDRNEELAYIFAERAAESGLPTAVFAMGYFWEIGMIVPVNLEVAMAWYEKAARMGNQEAVERIENLKQSSSLSRQDHEQIALTRIRSKYGSRRGRRPEYLDGHPARAVYINENVQRDRSASSRSGNSTLRRNAGTYPESRTDHSATSSTYHRTNTHVPTSTSVMINSSVSTNDSIVETSHASSDSSLRLGRTPTPPYICEPVRKVMSTSATTSTPEPIAAPKKSTGPKTFEDMGIPAAKTHNECIVI